MVTFRTPGSPPPELPKHFWIVSGSKVPVNATFVTATPLAVTAKSFTEVTQESLRGIVQLYWGACVNGKKRTRKSRPERFAIETRKLHSGVTLSKLALADSCYIELEPGLR